MEYTNLEDKVSIIIPSRNVDYLLEECILKIRELYKKVKIIIILDEINKNLPSEITVLKSKNLNMSAKRNQGVDAAETEYIAFLDSDSYPNNNWLEKGVSFLEENSSYSAVTGKQYNPPTDNLEQKCLRLIRFNRLFTHQKWCIIIDKNSKEQDCTEFITSNAIMRKADYIKLNGMNENIYLAEDNEFSNRLTTNGYKIRFIPEVSVFHRESKSYPYFRKIYCMSYYYANTLIKGKPVKPINQSIFQLFPLFGVFLFILLLWITKSIYIIFLPIIILFILLNETIIETKKLDKQHILGFIFIYLSFCIFCATWVIGTLFGLLNIKTQNIQKSYKHY